MLQDLTTDYERCRRELEQTIRQTRHVSFAEGNDREMRETQNESVRETVIPLDRVREPENLSTLPAQIKFTQSDRNKIPSRSQTKRSTLSSTLMHPRRPKRKEKEPDKCSLARLPSSF